MRFGMLLRSITQFSKLMSKEMYGDYCGDFAKLRTIPLPLHRGFHYVLTTF